MPVAADPADASKRIAELARRADVIYLGEQHDNPVHHAHQRQALDAIVAVGLEPSLAFEMLDEGQQAAVNDALAVPETAAALDERLGWRERGWPDFAMYWPLFETAQRARLPVVALNLDPAVSRRIAREGLDGLGPRGSGLASRLPRDPEREAVIARTIREGHCGLLPEARLPGMVEAWHARNVTMARRLATALEGGRPVVVIVGRGHQDAGGLPAQLARIRPGTRQLVVSMVEVAPGDSPEAAARGAAAEVVWLTPAVDRGDPCASLRRSSG